METRTAPGHCQLCSFCGMIGRILDLAQVHMMASLFFVFVLIQVFATLGYWTFSQQTKVCSPCFPLSHRDWISSAYWSPWDSEAPACDSGTFSQLRKHQLFPSLYLLSRFLLTPCCKNKRSFPSSRTSLELEFPRLSSTRVNAAKVRYMHLRSVCDLFRIMICY